MEFGGYNFVRQLAEAKARGEPELLRKVVTRAWQHRWILVLFGGVSTRYCGLVITAIYLSQHHLGGDTPAICFLEK